MPRSSVRTWTHALNAGATTQAQARLFEAMQADTTLVFAAEPSFRKLMARIATQEDAGVAAAGAPAMSMPTPEVRATRRAPGRAMRWLAAAVVLEGLGLSYGAWVWHSHNANPGSAYVTLTAPEPSYRDSPRIRIVFRSGLSVQGLGTILHGGGGPYRRWAHGIECLHTGLRRRRRDLGCDRATCCRAACQCRCAVCGAAGY